MNYQTLLNTLLIDFYIVFFLSLAIIISDIITNTVYLSAGWSPRSGITRSKGMCNFCVILVLKDSAKLLSLKVGTIYTPTRNYVSYLIPHVPYRWEAKTNKRTNKPLPLCFNVHCFILNAIEYLFICLRATYHSYLWSDP